MPTINVKINFQSNIKQIQSELDRLKNTTLNLRTNLTGLSGNNERIIGNTNSETLNNTRGGNAPPIITTPKFNKAAREFSKSIGASASKSFSNLDLSSSKVDFSKPAQTLSNRVTTGMTESLSNAFSGSMSSLAFNAIYGYVSKNLIGGISAAGVLEAQKPNYGLGMSDYFDVSNKWGIGMESIQRITMLVHNFTDTSGGPLKESLDSAGHLDRYLSMFGRNESQKVKDLDDIFTVLSNGGKFPTPAKQVLKNIGLGSNIGDLEDAAKQGVSTFNKKLNEVLEKRYPYEIMEQSLTVQLSMLSNKIANSLTAKFKDIEPTLMTMTKGVSSFADTLMVIPTQISYMLVSALVLPTIFRGIGTRLDMFANNLRKSEELIPYRTMSDSQLFKTTRKGDYNLSSRSQEYLAGVSPEMAKFVYDSDILPKRSVYDRIFGGFINPTDVIQYKKAESMLQLQSMGVTDSLFNKGVNLSKGNLTLLSEADVTRAGKIAGYLHNEIKDGRELSTRQLNLFGYDNEEQVISRDKAHKEWVKTGLGFNDLRRGDQKLLLNQQDYFNNIGYDDPKTIKSRVTSALSSVRSGIGVLSPLLISVPVILDFKERLGKIIKGEASQDDYISAIADFGITSMSSIGLLGALPGLFNRGGKKSGKGGKGGGGGGVPPNFERKIEEELEHELKLTPPVGGLNNFNPNERLTQKLVPNGNGINIPSSSINNVEREAEGISAGLLDVLMVGWNPLGNLKSTSGEDIKLRSEIKDLILTKSGLSGLRGGNSNNNSVKNLQDLRKTPVNSTKVNLLDGIIYGEEDKELQNDLLRMKNSPQFARDVDGYSSFYLLNSRNKKSSKTSGSILTKVKNPLSGIFGKSGTNERVLSQTEDLVNEDIKRTPKTNSKFNRWSPEMFNLLRNEDYTNFESETSKAEKEASKTPAVAEKAASNMSRLGKYASISGGILMMGLAAVGVGFVASEAALFEFGRWSDKFKAIASGTDADKMAVQAKVISSITSNLSGIISSILPIMALPMAIGTIGGGLAGAGFGSALKSGPLGGAFGAAAAVGTAGSLAGYLGGTYVGLQSISMILDSVKAWLPKIILLTDSIPYDITDHSVNLLPRLDKLTKIINNFSSIVEGINKLKDLGNVLKGGNGWGNTGGLAAAGGIGASIGAIIGGLTIGAGTGGLGLPAGMAVGAVAGGVAATGAMGLYQSLTKQWDGAFDLMGTLTQVFDAVDTISARLSGLEGMDITSYTNKFDKLDRITKVIGKLGELGTGLKSMVDMPNLKANSNTLNGTVDTIKDFVHQNTGGVTGGLIAGIVSSLIVVGAAASTTGLGAVVGLPLIGLGTIGGFLAGSYFDKATPDPKDLPEGNNSNIKEIKAKLIALDAFLQDDVKGNQKDLTDTIDIVDKIITDGQPFIDLAENTSRMEGLGKISTVFSALGSLATSTKSLMDMPKLDDNANTLGGNWDTFSNGIKAFLNWDRSFKLNGDYSQYNKYISTPEQTYSTGNQNAGEIKKRLVALSGLLDDSTSVTGIKSTVDEIIDKGVAIASIATDNIPGTDTKKLERLQQIATVFSGIGSIAKDIDTLFDSLSKMNDVFYVDGSQPKRNMPNSGNSTGMSYKQLLDDRLQAFKNLFEVNDNDKGSNGGTIDLIGGIRAISDKFKNINDAQSLINNLNKGVSLISPIAKMDEALDTLYAAFTKSKGGENKDFVDFHMENIRKDVDALFKEFQEIIDHVNGFQTQFNGKQGQAVDANITAFVDNGIMDKIVTKLTTFDEKLTNTTHTSIVDVISAALHDDDATKSLQAGVDEMGSIIQNAISSKTFTFNMDSGQANNIIHTKSNVMDKGYNTLNSEYDSDTGKWYDIDSIENGRYSVLNLNPLNYYKPNFKAANIGDIVDNPNDAHNVTPDSKEDYNNNVRDLNTKLQRPVNITVNQNGFLTADLMAQLEYSLSRSIAGLNNI